jgi:hypothetical protein
LTIDPDTTGDPVKDKILADNADFMKAYNEALASGDPNDPLLLAYGQPVGINYWQQGIKDQHAKGLTITGTERIYHRVVGDINTTKNPATATIYLCDDQTKAFDKEIATGKVHLTPVDDSDYILYYFGLQKASTGVWQVVHIITHQSDQAAKQECR